jgi:hypothetical protein
MKETLPKNVLHGFLAGRGSGEDDEEDNNEEKGGG